LKLKRTWRRKSKKSRFKDEIRESSTRSEQKSDLQDRHKRIV